MNVHYVTIRIQYKYTHPVYGEIYEGWVERGHHQQAFAQSREQALQFVQQTAARYEQAKAFTRDMQPVQYRVEVVWDGPTPTPEQVQVIERAAEDVRYLICAAGGMATKNLVEDYLIRYFGISRYLAHEIMNQQEIRNILPVVFSDGKAYWNQAQMLRPVPRPEDYPGLAEMAEAGR